jgi:hypothetical protein
MTNKILDQFANNLSDSACTKLYNAILCESIVVRLLVIVIDLSVIIGFVADCAACKHRKLFAHAVFKLIVSHNVGQ